MTLPFIQAITKFKDDILTGNLGIRFDSWPVFIAGAALFIISFIIMPSQVSLALSAAFFLAPVWLLPLLIRGAWRLWIIYKRSETIFNQTYILLEIRPPRNIVKTPLAMESFLSALHLTGGEGSWYDRFKGGVRPFYALEMVSLEGRVHLYLWTRANFRRLVESHLYAQYPGAQLVEVPDYTRMISADPDEWNVWGTDFKKVQPNPIPIKTYIEFGLDKVQEEPEQVDPMAHLIEYMGSIGKGEYIWLQFVFRAHRGEQYGDKWLVRPQASKVNKDGKPYTWLDEGKEIVEKIRKAARDTYVDSITGEIRPGFPNPTRGESDKMAAIERNITKLAFDVFIRSLYIADRTHFNPIAITNMVGLMKPFSTAGWNELNSTKGIKGFDDLPWEIFAEKKKMLYRRRLVENYRRRQGFHDPFFEGEVKQFAVPIFSTEEFATVFHLPTQAIETPGLGRIQSPTAEAPTNLPV